MEHPISIYNTLTRKKEQFIPLHEPHVGMYVCGPTVYGDAHLGHARPAITFDLLFRYLTHIGYKVRYVRNITDVGSGAVLPEPLPSRYGSAQRSTAQHRTACVRPYHRADRTGKENTG